jgi:cytochrome oxidase Cu insertion factor (SCO1/SenC/PrrC family)
MRLLSWAGAVLIATSATLPALAQEPDPGRAARWMDNLMWGRGHVGGPFELIDQNGNIRTDADFRGKLLIVYFGYTYCPDICPTDLTQIGLAVDKLG